MSTAHARLKNILPCFASEPIEDIRVDRLIKQGIKIRQALQAINKQAKQGKPSLIWVCDDKSPNSLAYKPAHRIIEAIAVGMMVGGFGGMLSVLAYLLF